MTCCKPISIFTAVIPVVIAAVYWTACSQTGAASLPDRFRSLPVAGSDPQLPQEYIDTTYTPSACTFYPERAADLQAALDRAELGNTICLSKGAVYRGNFVLRKKPAGASWITIRTAAESELPPPGTRATPAHRAAMPSIVAMGADPAFRTEPGAHHYRFVGLEIMSDPDYTGTNYNLVYVHAASVASFDDLPSYFIFDRVYVHGHPNRTVRRGIALNSTYAAVVDSSVSEIHEVGADSQAVASWGGPGPFKIVNNYLEAAGENVMFGGARPQLEGLIHSDIEVRGNHFYKPWSWRRRAGPAPPADPCSFDERTGKPGERYREIDANRETVAWYQCENGSWVRSAEPFPDPWTVKNLFELKNAQRVIVEGNIFENNWAHAQSGFAILFQGFPNDSGRWATVTDVTFRHNLLTHIAHGVNLCGGCIYAPLQIKDPDAPNYIEPAVPRLERVRFHDNLFHDVRGRVFGWNEYGRLFQVLNNSKNVVIEHNTGFHDGTPLFLDGRPVHALVFRHNILNLGSGILGTGTINSKTFERFAPDATLQQNLFLNPPRGFSAQMLPSDNYFANMEDAGFEDYARGLFSLLPGTRYAHLAPEGRDLGADILSVREKTAAVLTGAPIPPTRRRTR
jgi:hypothetical protein